MNKSFINSYSFILYKIFIFILKIKFFFIMIVKKIKKNFTIDKKKIDLICYKNKINYVRS